MSEQKPVRPEIAASIDRVRAKHAGALSRLADGTPTEPTEKDMQTAREIWEAHLYGFGDSADRHITAIARALTQARQEAAPKPCLWTVSDDVDSEYWDTECGQAFCLITGTLAENDYRHCPFCGGKIQTATPPPTENER